MLHPPVLIAEVFVTQENELTHFCCLPFVLLQKPEGEAPCLGINVGQYLRNKKRDYYKGAHSLLPQDVV